MTMTCQPKFVQNILKKCFLCAWKSWPGWNHDFPNCSWYWCWKEGFGTRKNRGMKYGKTQQLSFGPGRSKRSMNSNLSKLPFKSVIQTNDSWLNEILSSTLDPMLIWLMLKPSWALNLFLVCTLMSSNHPSDLEANPSLPSLPWETPVKNMTIWTQHYHWSWRHCICWWFTWRTHHSCRHKNDN